MHTVNDQEVLHVFTVIICPSDYSVPSHAGCLLIDDRMMYIYIYLIPHCRF